uniref:Putative pheromone n=1 Tax=Flammulina velutipes TaxID=38945 RepID=M4MED0_FLAVE|nr:putative pheromone precursor [Flammulina velutipes]QHW03307.1 putative pheromone precursor protein [Flammulina velutipes]
MDAFTIIPDFESSVAFNDEETPFADFEREDAPTLRGGSCIIA